MAETAPFAPKIHMPDPEAEALRAAYRDARVIGEYGAGGSTAFAATECDARLLSIESDRDWVAKLQDWIDAQGVTPGRLQILGDHLGAHLTHADLRYPAQPFFGPGRVTEQRLHLGRPEIARIDPHHHVTRLERRGLVTSHPLHHRVLVLALVRQYGAACLAAVIGVVALGEQLSAAQAIGLVFMVAGTALMLELVPAWVLARLRR